MQVDFFIDGIFPLCSLAKSIMPFVVKSPNFGKIKISL